jgi:hypothetical protein
MSRGDQDLLKQALDKGIAQPVILARVEQKSEEIGVTQLLADDADCLEDVELLQQPFKGFQIGVLDYERFECAPVVEKLHHALGRIGHDSILGYFNSGSALLISAF